MKTKENADLSSQGNKVWEEAKDQFLAESLFVSFITENHYQY